jgi:hypothetical protein
MKRLRLATWSALAGLTLVAGCQSSSTSCCGESPGLLTRLGLRPNTSGTVIYDGPVQGMPGAGMPYTAPIGTAPVPGADCPCSAGGGPMLGTPPFMPVPGGAVPGTLPPPYPGAAPPLAPVPNGGQATPTPAPPMSRRG